MGKTFFESAGATCRRGGMTALQICLEAATGFYLPSHDFFVEFSGSSIVFCDDGGDFLVAAYVAFAHPTQHFASSIHFFNEFFTCYTQAARKGGEQEAAI